MVCVELMRVWLMKYQSITPLAGAGAFHIKDKERLVISYIFTSLLPRPAGAETDEAKMLYIN